MAEADELIFDDEEFDLDETPEQEPSKEEPKEDLTLEILKMLGITDPSKIKFEDTNGTIIERSWDSLTREEQLNILSPQIPEDIDLSDDEIDLINTIRQSGMEINDYLKSLVPEPQQLFKVDLLSDDDIYALDLLEKVGSDNITDEELQEAINEAKKNESLYKKTVEGLRREYIKLQQDEETRQLDALLAQQQQQYNEFANSILNEIRNLDSFAGQDLELSQEDSEELADFILNLDENGNSKFGKALQNGKLFTEAAFWLLHKDLIILELNEAIQNSYKRGYEAAQTKVVFKPSEKADTMFDSLDDVEW